MNKAEIKLNQEYAFREKRSDSVLQRIKVLEHIRRDKWKAQWIEPNPGLTDYVESGQILCRWKEHQAFLRDEEHARQLDQYNTSCKFDPKSPVTNAVEQVFESVGEEVSCYRGVLTGSPDAVARIKERAKDENGRDPLYAYRDRFGKTHWPFQAAFELARKFCAAEPSTVLVGLESTEREWSTQASRPGEDYLVPLLNEYRASWALIRQWTGHDPAIAEREAYIERLERLVWDAVYALQRAGLDRDATRLRNLLEKH
jgi:hypothetical protein